MKKRFLPPGMKHAAEAYELLIDGAMYRLSGGAWKTVMYLVRRTVGFGKASDKVSLEQLCHGIVKRNGERLDHGTGLSRRAVIRGLNELERRGLLYRSGGRGLTGNYAVNWAVFQNDTSAKSTPVASAKSGEEPVPKCHPQLSVVQPSGVQPSTTRDIDCAPTNGKKPHSQARVCLPGSACKQYPRLKRALREYMNADADEPSDRLVVEVFDAANGETEEAVIDCLRHLYYDRGLKPGTENGPRLWAWFPIVVQDYFERIEARRDAAHPCGYDEWAERNETRLDSETYSAMTAALEIPPEVQ